MAQGSNFTITFGGWYQRTTLHLSEIYEFLAKGQSRLDLSKERLKELHFALDLKEVTREVGNLEYVRAKTHGAVEIRYYEDGLYVLELSSSNIKSGRKTLEDYFTKAFNPGISYIFSLGAPTPKILANIQTTHPTVISIASENPNNFRMDKKEFGEVYSQISSEGITVYKTPNYIFVLTQDKQKETARDLVEMQIFFREFKDQLERYLNIHRKLWEEISSIKERQSIRGYEIGPIRTKLDGYQKTINLIGSRINQMGAYVHTRASIAKQVQIESKLVTLFQYKFEVLSDTHIYIKEIWKMTSDYLTTAIDILKDIENRSLNNSIKSLQVITSIGVVAGIIGYLSKDTLPKITGPGLIYFFALILIIWPINYLIGLIYRNFKYKLNFPERAVNL